MIKRWLLMLCILLSILATGCKQEYNPFHTTNEHRKPVIGEPVAVPEPQTILLFGAGLLILSAAQSWRRMK